MNGCTGEIGTVEGHEPIDQCNRDLRPTLGALHRHEHPAKLRGLIALP